MNIKAFKTLEFDKIIKKLINITVSPMGKEKASNIKPYINLDDVLKVQKETSEAVSMCMRKGNISLGGLREIRPQLKRVSIGGVLSIQEFIDIRDFLYVCKKVKNYSKNENKDERYDILDEFFYVLEPLPNLENEISRCILSETEISDDASIELKNIRKEIKISNDRIREQLNNIINSSSYKNMLQDSVITIRNDRYCVPIKSEYRNSFQGMIHDQSNTGSTLFIEPLRIIELNNKIKELQLKEKDEIDKILLYLSELVKENLDIFNINIEVLTEIDFIFAKANLSILMKGIEPKFNNKGYINIKLGRHPLLDNNLVVPINIYLGKDFTTLLITGPNTGGKTVALKTLGLFTLMGQAGLHIPAFDNSELSIFDNIFADIGDEQSIEQNLSTFSAHMTNIVKILENVTTNSLVLFDELGAGTDPTEGAALALAIIQYLFNMKIRTVVTTHYSELKLYALSTDGVENACCEFDVETLKPTYKLLIGIPGKSNAFAISKKLGLQDYIINIAKDLISKEDLKLEDVITDLEISKKNIVYEQERAEQYRKEAENLKKDFEKQKIKINQQKEKILSKARDEAQNIYIRAKEEADKIIKDLNKQAKTKSIHKMNEERLKIKNRIKDIQQKSLKDVNKFNSKPLKSISIGDKVYVISFDQYGTVISKLNNNNEVMVQIGIMKIKVSLDDLMSDERKDTLKKEKVNLSTNVKARKSLYISPEIDCRGQMIEECIGNIDKYIDDAYLSGLQKVTIIHGKGTGILRNAVWKYLKSSPHVLSFRQGDFTEGELGVTIVELK